MKSKMLLKAVVAALLFFVGLSNISPVALEAFTSTPTQDPTLIPKYVDPLVVPPAMPKTSTTAAEDYYEISTKQFSQQVLPTGMPQTTVWGYGSVQNPGTFNYPAFTIEATVNKPVRVKWVNGLVDATGNYLPHLLPVDQTIDWANPPGGTMGRDMVGTDPTSYTGPVPLVVHAHGVHTNQESDGYAEAWYLPAANNIPAGYATEGTYFNPNKTKSKFGYQWGAGAAVFDYPNDQNAATAWYHDHAMGMDRLNVYAGLAGFYLIRGGAGDVVTTKTGAAAVLPGPAPTTTNTGCFEIPLAIQDKSFNSDGSLFYPDSRLYFDAFAGPYAPTSDIAPIWNPEFFGNTMLVNGKTWPYLTVEAKRYRFRIVNGCNSRMLLLQFDNNMPFWQIGAEGGFLSLNPVQRTQMHMGNGERADVIVDFTNVPVGTNVIMQNIGADAPFTGVPGVDFVSADPATTGQVMQFRVVAATSPDLSTPPDQLVLPARTDLGAVNNTRQISLNEMSSNVLPGIGPRMALMGTVDLSISTSPVGVPKLWSDAVTENPALNATEIWEMYNFTVDAHPVHIHQVQFEVVNREIFDPAAGVVGTINPPELWESGTKDTVVSYPGQITRVKAKFDVPGLFVWHCHILEHEENEMMRPMFIGAMPSTSTVASASVIPVANDAATIPKYVDPLVVPPAMPTTTTSATEDYYEISTKQFSQQVLPTGMPKTTVWGYGSVQNPGTFNYPAFTIEAKANKPVRVKWINGLVDASGNYLPHLLPVDQTIHWANPAAGLTGRDSPGTDPASYTGPVPLVVHAHGVHTNQESDGYAEAWYLPVANNIPTGYATVGTWYDLNKSLSKFGSQWAGGAAVFDYPNDQAAGTAWYHDHAMGMDRLNVYAGLAGFYLIRGGASDIVTTKAGGAAVLPGPAPTTTNTGCFEIPLAIQDKSFNADGSLFYPNTRAFFDGFTGPYAPQSDIAPIWNPEFFGNTMLVNGKTWPYLTVEQKRYRFRIVNGCNSRLLLLKLDNNLPFWQIGAEGGFLSSPVSLTQLLIGNGERADVIVDFTNVPAGTNVMMQNIGADSPFVPGTTFTPADPNTTGQVMQFRVVAKTSPDLSTPADQLVLPARTPLGAVNMARQISLNEMDSNVLTGVGPRMALLGKVDLTGPTPVGVPKMWKDTVTEDPDLGSIEQWEIYNFTVDAHPVHIHQVQFEVVNREVFDPAAGIVGTVKPPEVWESGGKDTLIAYPGEITRVKAKFDIPGIFVWHCHILEHEENEMMRPFFVGEITSTTTIANITMYPEPDEVELPSEFGPVQLQISSGTFAQHVTLTIATVTVTTAVVPPTTPTTTTTTTSTATVTTTVTPVTTVIPTPKQKNLKVSKVVVNINNKQNLQPVKPITVTMTYKPANVTGMNTKKLSLAAYNPATATFVPIPSKVNTTTGKVTGKIKHFSIYAIVELVPEVDLGKVKVYPNPFDPNITDVTIGNLTSAADIRIYTITGELVRRLDYNSADGLVTWDGTNDSGSKVASGIYLALINGSEGKKVVKIAVEK
ncbi:MAG: multicopper oxidase domain-containing protein [Elusimicrobia bacterium]|nr:multicopper oxidase domain-containing protein [Candidatus Liberimonas magnetica]